MEGHPGGDEGRAAVLAAAPSRARTRALTALAWALGLVLLAWVTRGVRWVDLARTLRPIPWWAWAVAAAGLAASYLFRALRIHAELSRRHPVTVGQCLRVMLLHNAAVNVVPLRGGEVAYPLLVNRVLGVPLGQAVASLVWIRAQDLLLLSLAVVVLLPRLSAPARLGLAGAILGAALSLVALLQRAMARPWAAAPHGGRGRSVLGALRALSEAPRHGVAGWAYGSASWAAKLLALGFLLSRLGGLAPASAVAAALGGELAGVLPLQGPAGFGTYETGVWAGASLHGASSLGVAAPAVAVHLFSLATAVLGGALARAVPRVSSRRWPIATAPAPEDRRA